MLCVRVCLWQLCAIICLYSLHCYCTTNHAINYLYTVQSIISIISLLSVYSITSIKPCRSTFSTFSSGQSLEAHHSAVFFSLPIENTEPISRTSTGHHPITTTTTNMMTTTANTMKTTTKIVVNPRTISRRVRSVHVVIGGLGFESFLRRSFVVVLVSALYLFCIFDRFRDKFRQIASKCFRNRFETSVGRAMGWTTISSASVCGEKRSPKTAARSIARSPNRSTTLQH